MRYSLACPLIFVGALLIVTEGRGQTLPPAGMEVLPIVVTVDTVTRLGEERVILTGWMQVDRAMPRLEDGVEIVDLEIVTLQLRGASRLGLVSVGERLDVVSRGELRSLQPGEAFPASHLFDLFADISAPASPIGALSLHNESALRLLPWEGERETPLSGWPPLGVGYRLAPIFGVDNDGDGSIDEDTADDDGDLLLDEDRPGTDPETPGFQACGDDADCDELEGEDPPTGLCPPALCDGDGDGSIDEDPACVPLLNQQGTHLKLGLCVRDLGLAVAPELPSYSVARGGLSRLHPADILALTPKSAEDRSAQAPFVRIRCADLGLSADGCDDGADGDQDDLDALSYGMDFAEGGESQVYFSVGPGAQGAPGSAVEGQRNCPPAQPGASPEPEPDEFGSALDGTNQLVLDGNGPVGACSPAFPLGLIEARAARDNLDALDGRESSAVDADGDGVPDRPVYFSLDAASPSLEAFGFSSADVLRTVDGGQPQVYASATELGLAAGDDLDALCLGESGDGIYQREDVLYFSLTPRSPSLSAIGAGPGDLLAPGHRPAVVQRGPSLGLAATDDLDALQCQTLLAPTEANGDVNCDDTTNRIDALLVLQYEAGLFDWLPCAQGADVDGSGAVNSIDATLILQFDAGLLQRLPPPREGGPKVGRIMAALLGRRGVT